MGVPTRISPSVRNDVPVPVGRLTGTVIGSMLGRSAFEHDIVEKFPYAIDGAFALGLLSPELFQLESVSLLPPPVQLPPIIGLRLQKLGAAEPAS
jgi:hypothetical protein